MSETILISDYVTVIQGGTRFEVFAYTRIDSELYTSLRCKNVNYHSIRNTLRCIKSYQPCWDYLVPPTTEQTIAPTDKQPETLTDSQLPSPTPTTPPRNPPTTPSTCNNCYIAPLPHTDKLHQLHTYILFHYPCSVLYNDQIIHSVILSEYQFNTPTST